MAQAQSDPTTANHPDYRALKQATSGVRPDRSIDEALDLALPDNPTSPTLKVFKDLVREFMSQRDEHGLIMKPCTWQAMAGVRHVLDTNPQLANAELVKSITHAALHDGETNVGRDPFSNGRHGAVLALGTIVDRRPDLADAALVRNVTAIAANDPDSEVRATAQNALAKIASQRPDLVDVDMVKIVSGTAALPIADHGENTGFVRYTEKLVGWQDDIADNEARGTAQKTLKTITEKRPDLTAVSNPAVAPKHGSASPHFHANVIPPRLSRSEAGPQ
jgi:hypothetical protein